MSLSITSVGLIGLGEAGGIIGQDLVKRGVHVFAYDRQIHDPERRTQLHARAQEYGVRLVSTLEQAVGACALVISTVSPDSALEVALSVAKRHPHDQLFMDLNSVAPQTKQLARDEIERCGGSYIDAVPLAPLPEKRLQTQILLSGTTAHLLAPALQSLGMNVRVLSNVAGQACAVKMCLNIMIGGLEALTTECLSTARQYRIEKEVLASLDDRFPGMGWDGQLPDYLLGRVSEHGHRSAEEIGEAIKTVECFGIPPLMTNAIGAVQIRLIDAMSEAEIKHTDLNPFNWTDLVDGIYGATVVPH